MNLNREQYHRVSSNVYSLMVKLNLKTELVLNAQQSTLFQVKCWYLTSNITKPGEQVYAKQVTNYKIECFGGWTASKTNIEQVS